MSLELPIAYKGKHAVIKISDMEIERNSKEQIIEAIKNRFDNICSIIDKSMEQI